LTSQAAQATITRLSSPYALSLAEASQEIREQRLSPVEVVESALARIAEVEAAIQAFVEVDGPAVSALLRRRPAGVRCEASVIARARHRRAVQAWRRGGTQAPE
jgi:aspartyl-tRNA(Asn)/glutamyl-tRNA(Gln) amidotransferase subunit A